MIQRHLTFKVTAEHADAFERYFQQRYRPAMAQAPGYVRAELLREVDDPTRYRMTLGWADADAAAGWRTSPVHQGLQPELNELHEGMEGISYQVVA
jgi:heme-degrading monooxygenase HmoA